MIKIFVTTLSMVFLLGFNTVGAVTFTIGDNDNFSSQSAAEAAATNGAQFTDLSASGFGTSLKTIPVVFNFTPFSSITSAVFSVRSLGIQTNDTNPATSSFGEDGLKLDGVLVPEFFAGVEQGGTGIGTVSQVLASSFFSSLADGNAIFTILMNSKAGTSTPNGEPVAFDFFELTIEGIQGTQVGVVPLPAALPLYASGLGLLGFLGWRRKRQIATVA